MMKKRANKLPLLFQAVLACLIWLGVAAAVCLGNSASEFAASRVVPTYRGDARFVFADLDGDRKPDLARVELESQRSAKTNYFIYVKLSAGTESAIGVDGPIGGLRVAARDVNGDDNLDLIVTSNLDADFITVLLNDGHGNFTAAQPGDYIPPETESDVLHGPLGTQANRAAVGSMRTSHEDGIVEDVRYNPTCSADVCSQPVIQPAVQQVVLLCLGRSPPAIVAVS
jgi:hypothetical protein